MQAAAQRPTQPTAVMGQGERRSPQELAARDGQLALAAARQKYEENVALISGEYTPLTIYDPVIHETASVGLGVMGGVAVGAAVPASVLRWTGGALETGTGLRASYTAWRRAPAFFLRGAGYRVMFDGIGQYAGIRIFGGKTLFEKGWLESLGEINFFQTAASAVNLNPYTGSVVTGAFAYSVNNGFQSMFYDVDKDPRGLNRTKFVTQVTAGLLLTKGGRLFEARMEQHQFVSWQLYRGAMALGVSHLAKPATVRWGQTYLPPLTTSVVGSVTGAAVGFGTDKLTAPDSTATPTHPDSPLFLK